MSDFASYKGKRVVITGCFSGMGEATARLLQQQGAEVHGLDYKPTALKLASFNQVDLRDPSAIDAAVASIGGKVDALFNCAGLPQTASGLDVMKVNYMGTRRVTERVLPLMGKGGAICSISSTAGLGWSRRMPVLMGLIKLGAYEDAVKWCEENADTVKEGYQLSKEAIIVWTMLTAAHVIKKGIRMNCTLPGPTQTPMMKEFESKTPLAIIDAAAQPINRRATPEEQAGALVFLNSDAASYVNGVALPVDGGFIGAIATGQIDMASLTGGAPQQQRAQA
jgi:NAD(P)-dependent dehydrogenase (short-subunit alcohol dehydrogenase family)